MRHSKQRRGGKYKPFKTLLLTTLPSGESADFCTVIENDLFSEHLTNGDYLFFKRSNRVKDGKINAIVTNGKIELMRIYVNGGGNDAACFRLEAGRDNIPEIFDIDTLNIYGYATHALKPIV